MILGNNILPCEGEVSVRSYLCTKFNSPLYGIKAEGFVEVTNKRLLFQARGNSIKGWSVIHNEVAIMDVSEIKIYKGSSFDTAIFLLLLIISVLFTGVIIALFNQMINMGVGIFLGLIALGYFLYRSYLLAQKEAFSVIINTKGGNGNVVYIAGLSPFASANTAASKALNASPGVDSERMLKEIGAVILDIQNMGEYGIEKWKK